MKTLYLSIIIGLGIVVAITIGLVFIPDFTNRPTDLKFINNSLEVENICGQFHTVSEKHDIYIIPVLLMDSNSTDCFKITFTVADTHDLVNYTHRLAILRQELNFRIGNYNETTNGNSFGISPGKDYANSFEISHISQTVDGYPANYRIGEDPQTYPTGTNFTEAYVIKALPTAKGFYDYSIPGPNCSHYPLAVGYIANRVNASNFSKVNHLGQTCERSPYKITSVQISGMSYKELQLEPISLEVGK